MHAGWDSVELHLYQVMSFEKSTDTGFRSFKCHQEREKKKNLHKMF